MILVIYMLTIAWYIVIARAVSGDFSESRQFNFTPFWSYANFRHADFRWQIFLNILVFIPFGFMLPWALNLPFWKSVLVGLAFSVLLEATQFLFCLGFCETDDLIHNTLGTTIGYGYWKLLQITFHHLQKERNMTTLQAEFLKALRHALNTPDAAAEPFPEVLAEASEQAAGDASGRQDLFCATA